MTLEDQAFERIVSHIEISRQLDLLSAHPPSGKSYFTDLIRIPSPTQDKTGARRAHIDVIFCSAKRLYLCELKGTSAESDDDIAKLRRIRGHYTLDRLTRFISDRLTFPSERLATVDTLVLSIGCAVINNPQQPDVLYIEAEADSLRLHGPIALSVSDDFIPQ